MWQRIQTLYFILVLLLMVAAILLPNAEFYNAASNTDYQLDMRGVVQLNEEGMATKTIGNSPLTILFGIILFLSAYTITQFKNRRKQIRMATLTLFLLIIYIGVLTAYILTAKNRLDVEVRLLLPVAFPAIALIFNYLGMRGVAKDEKLVRSLDRLR